MSECKPFFNYDIIRTISLIYLRINKKVCVNIGKVKKHIF